MFRQKGALSSTIIVLLLLFVKSHCQSNSRSYDTNDWIPVSRPCPTCFQNSESQQESVQKKPTGRILNLPAADQKRYLPEETRNFNPEVYQPTGKQYNVAGRDQQLEAIRQNAQFQQQAAKLPDITTYVPGGQQVLLPPQLQNIVSQGQPFLSPQRINSQLLGDVPYQQPIPLSEFNGNISQYNLREIDNLYDQRLIKQNPQLQQQQRQNFQQNFQPNTKLHSNNAPEEVQLLYVPLENLRPRGQKLRGQQISLPTEHSYQPLQTYQQPPPTQQFQSTVPHKQVQLHNIEQDFAQQALQAQKLQEQLQQNIQQQQILPQRNRSPHVQPTTTVLPPAAPKKRKPHQPPLAVYMGIEGHQDIKVSDVLTLLKDAKTISVQDRVGPDSPQVFVGPSHLEPPEGYVKFDLPYLSSIEGSRVERKVDQLPFFVAPLSYKAPPGYSKIPFPAPHVGSVVVNHMKELEEQARKENPVINLPEYKLGTTERNTLSQNSEVSTTRSRTRQRPSTRVSYPSSSLPPPPTVGDIPYHSLPKESLPIQSQSVDDTLISTNPYGPTQFVQSTTPAYNLEDNPIPEQLFSTYSRYSTPTPYKSQEIPAVNQQFLPLPKQQATTEQPAVTSTQPGTISNDKFTVLEQLPISDRQRAEKYQLENIPQRDNPQHSLRGHQTQQEFVNNYKEKPLSSLSHNTEINQPQSVYPAKDDAYIDQFQSSFPQTQFSTVPPITNNQNKINKQVYLDQYNQQAEQILNNRNQLTATHLENFQQPVQHQHNLQDQIKVDTPVENIKQRTRQRGHQQYTLNDYYEDQYTSPRPAEQTLQYNVPNKHTFKEVNSDYNARQVPVQSVRTQQTKSRGRQHFTPQPEYVDDYERPVEAYVQNQQPITKTSAPDYNIEITTQQPSRNRDENQQSPESHYRGDITPTPADEQDYVLPVQLPAISPQLPGLVNSLEDQAIRPLLAPLLIPASEQTPTIDSNTEYPTHPPTTTTSTTSTTTTTTIAPIIETTTQSKRLRSRHRGTRPTFSTEYSNTTPSSRRPPSYRGRRPYSGRTRTEYTKPAQYLEEVTPTTNILHQDITTEAPIRNNVYTSRNRFAIQRDRTYASSTTEVPRRTLSPSRQRFRTRGRPVKTEDDYISVPTGTTPDNAASFKEPILEGGFQASVPIAQNNAYLPNSYSHLPNENEPVLIQTSQDGASVKFVPKSNQNNPENIAVHLNADQYIVSTSKPVIQNQQVSVPLSAPENNVVGDVIHVDPALVRNHESDQVKYSHAIDPNSKLVQYTPSEEINYNTRESQYSNSDSKIKTYHPTYIPETEPEHHVLTTTETSKVRSRTRSRQRTRGHSNGNTLRQQVQQHPTTTTVRTTTEGKDESDEEEFYGFLRQPDFVKPVQVGYKQSSDLRTVSRPVPNVAYLSREQDDQPVYVNTAHTAQPTLDNYQPLEHSHEATLDSDVPVQYVPRTTTIPTTTAIIEDTTADIKPVTRRPSTTFVRTRRPTITTEPTTEAPLRVSEKYFTARPAKRPESQTPKITRIRGRIRKPTKPTTTPASVETEVPYTQQSIHTSKQTDLPSSREPIASLRQRQRVYNRGRTHFQYTSNDKRLAADEQDSPNYPTSFLQAHGLPTPKSAALTGLSQSPTQKPDLSSQEFITPKTSFQLTIEPDDIDDEYVDQLPYSSVHKPKLSSKDLEDGAESQFSSKVIEKPSNYNFIPNNEKNASGIDDTTSKNTNNNEGIDTTTELQLQITTLTPNDSTLRGDVTTEMPTTTDVIETEKPKSRRRGYWRLVDQRPVGDVLESAESQNIGTVYSNNLYGDEKSERKYKTIERAKTTTESVKEITTITPGITTMVFNNLPSTSSTLDTKASRPEDEMLVPLYEMFGLDYDGSKTSKTEEQQNNSETTTQLPTTFYQDPERPETTTNNEFNTTTVTEVPHSSEDETLVYSDQNLQNKNEWEVTDEAWKSRIIGTSTTTEVSHETEICYRGRCVKSTTSENSSEV